MGFKEIDKEIDLTLGYYNEHTKADYADKYTSTGVFQTSKDKKEWYDYRRYDYSLGYSGKTDNSDYMIRTFYSRLIKKIIYIIIAIIFQDQWKIFWVQCIQNMIGINPLIRFGA